MQKVQIAKTVVKTVVGVGAAKIINSIIASNTTQENLTDKVTMTAGSFVLGSMTGELVGRYTDAKIDELVNFMKSSTDK